MGVLVPIVEGFGEVEAVPILLRKLLRERDRHDLKIAQPKNAHGCGNLTKHGGIERFVELAFRERDCSGVLVLMDADSDRGCAVTLAKTMAARVAQHGARFPVAITLARREFECWFLASLESIAGGSLGGRPGLPAGLTFEGDIERVRDAKGWLSRHFAGSRIYKETEDQAPMTDRLDLRRGRERSRSFRRLCHCVDQLLQMIEEGSRLVTPS